MFRILFTYAILRGVLDSLTRRPDLQKRLARVYFRRAQRQVLAASAAINLAMGDAQQHIYETSRACKTASRILAWYRFKAAAKELLWAFK